MIDHCGVNVSDYIDSRDFYKNALSAIGYEIIMEFDGQVAGFGKDNVPDFWIKCGYCVCHLWLWLLLVKNLPAFYHFDYFISIHIVNFLVL